MSLNVLVMALFDLSKEIIIMILEELDPWTLVQFCMASRRVKLIAFNCTALRYNYELVLCGMKDGGQCTQPPRTRLEQLFLHKLQWPALQWSSEDKLRIPPPTIMGVSGGFFFHASENSLSNGVFQWTLQLYELRSFRRNDTVLRQCRFNVPFEIRRVTIDRSQALMVLAELYHPHNNAVVTARLHFLDLWSCQQHSQANQLRYAFRTDWWGQLPPGQRIWIQQVEICGNKVGLAVRLEIEEGEGTTELIIVNWRTGTPRRYTGDLHSFHLISETRLLVVSHPDEDDDDNDENYNDEGSTDEDSDGAWEQREDGIYMPEQGPRLPPQITLHDISDNIIPPFPRIRTYELPESWRCICFMHILANSSPRSEAEVMSGTYFYSDPSQRVIVVQLQFKTGVIPPGCSRNMVLVFSEQLPSPPGQGEDTIVRWNEWRHRCLVRNLADGAHSLQVVGRRLMFFDNNAPSACTPVPSDDPRIRIRIIEFNPLAHEYLQSHTSSPPPWTWDGRWKTITAVAPHRAFPSIRTTTVNSHDISWFNLTEDGLVLYDEHDDETIVRIVTIGKPPPQVAGGASMLA